MGSITCHIAKTWSLKENITDIDPETNTYNNVTTFNNYYQLYAELNVFDGFATINALKQAKLSRDYSATAMQKIQDDRAIDVMQKYDVEGAKMDAETFSMDG